MVKQFNIILPPFKRGFHLITNNILKEIGDLPDVGLINIFIKHCSAGLTINENADSSVRRDFETSFNKIIPENACYYTHTTEGSDDMPAHIKSTLVGSSLTIPISNCRLNLGIWQGIYLCEFRDYGGSREIVVSIYS